jgi:hypothetical protein
LELFRAELFSADGCRESARIIRTLILQLADQFGVFGLHLMECKVSCKSCGFLADLATVSSGSFP